jgi:hypothetical protein
MTPAWRAGIAQALVILAVLWLVLDGPSGRVRAPVRFTGGGLVSLGDVKAGWESGRWWSMPDLAAPDRYADPLLAPAYAHVDYLLVNIAHVVSRGVPAVVSLAWALMLVLAGASASWCLHRLGVSGSSAWAAGVLFALSPFTLSNNTEMFGLVPAFVPFAIFAAIALALGRMPSPRDRDWRVVLAGCALLALNSIYYGTFAILVVGVGAVAGWVRTRRMASIRSGASVLLVLVFALSISGLTSQRTLDTGVVHTLNAVRPSDAELFSLKIRTLVTPMRGNWIAPLARWAERDEVARFPPVFGRARLGVLGSLGLVGLVIVLFVPIAAAPDEEGEALKAASRLNLAVLLVGMTGALGSVFTAVLAPRLTNYTLLTPFVAFLAVMSVAIFIDRFLYGRPWWRVGIWVALFVFAAVDHGVAIEPVMATRADVAAESQGIRDVIVAFEQRLPAGALVAQLPVQAEPNQQHKMHAFDQLKPYVLSRTLRWTFPATTPERQKWLDDLAAVKPEDLVARLRQDGVSAVLIDRLAYPDDGAALLTEVGKSLSTTEPVMPHNRYVALDIRQR